MKTNTHTPQRLIHACCAHCTEEYLLRTSNFQTIPKSGVELVILYDNSNIHPRTEYLARLHAMQVIAERHDIKMFVADWSPKKWFEAVGNWKEIGKAERCRRCWRFRLEQTATKALELGIVQFSTTMLTSEYMNTKAISSIGSEIAGNTLQFVGLKKSGISNFTGDPCDSPSGKGYYRQNYCGCVYSLTERFEEKFVVV